MPTNDQVLEGIATFEKELPRSMRKQALELYLLMALNEQLEIIAGAMVHLEKLTKSVEKTGTEISAAIHEMVVRGK